MKTPLRTDIASVVAIGAGTLVSFALGGVMLARGHNHDHDFNFERMVDVERMAPMAVCADGIVALHGDHETHAEHAKHLAIAANGEEYEGKLEAAMDEMNRELASMKGTEAQIEAAEARIEAAEAAIDAAEAKIEAAVEEAELHANVEGARAAMECAISEADVMEHAVEMGGTIVRADGEVILEHSHDGSAHRHRITSSGAVEQEIVIKSGGEGEPRVSKSREVRVKVRPRL